MRSLVWIGMALFALAGCGDSDAEGLAFGARTLCEDVCSWPGSCFGEFAPELPDADCIEACEASLDVVSPACLEAIDATVLLCLGTCNEDDISIADVERCQDLALQVDSAC